MGAGPRLAPGLTVEPLADRERQEGVPGRVELDFVPAAAEAVEGVEDGRVPVRLHSPVAHLLTAEALPEGGELRLRPAGPLPAERLDERPVGGEQVGVDERRGLVEDVVGGHAEGPQMRAAIA
jgi:hypothetical protein